MKRHINKNVLPHMFSPLPWTLAPFVIIWLILLFYNLGIRPPHHDEGVNGWFVMQMWRNGFFRYDPSNYHGPLFFYLLQLSEILFGKSIVSMRLVTVLFAASNTLLILAHRRFFGRIAIWAAFVMAFSPAALFYGRYAIHETVFIFFQILFSYGYFTYVRCISWRTGVLCMIAGFFGAVMIKETFIIFFGTWLIAHFMVTALSRFLPETKIDQEEELTGYNDRGNFQSTFVPPNHRQFLFFAICAGALMSIMVFSGFLMNLHGIYDMFVSLAPWLKTGMASGHNKPFFYWIMLMLVYEWPILAAFIATIFIGRRNSRHGRFWCLLSMGCVLAYSIIPYKTPWLILNLVWPLCFVFGYTVEIIAQKRPIIGKRIAYSVAALLILTSVLRANRIIIHHPADIEEPYLYTHSHESINQLKHYIERACDRHPEAHNMRITVATQQTWPLPWTLSDYTNRHSTPFKADKKIKGDVIIADIQDQDAVEAMLTAPYYRIKGKLRGSYGDILYYFSEAQFKDSWQGEGTLVNRSQVQKESVR